MSSALITMLRKRLMVTWLWQALFVLAVIGGFVSHHLTVAEMMGRTRFVAMDSRDTFYLANLGNFETAQRIHEELAKMAAETSSAAIRMDSIIRNDLSAFLIRQQRRL